MVHGPNATNEEYIENALQERGASQTQAEVISQYNELEYGDVSVLGETDEGIVKVDGMVHDTVGNAVEYILDETDASENGVYEALEAETQAGIKKGVSEDGGPIPDGGKLISDLDPEEDDREYDEVRHLLTGGRWRGKK